jgi:hypothetical protein
MLFHIVYWLVPVAAVTLTLIRRTRPWGAGLLLGLAVGSIIGAGACVTGVGLNG